MKLYEEAITPKVRTLNQTLFSEQHPEVSLIYPEIPFLNSQQTKAFEVNLSNFDYILK